MLYFLLGDKTKGILSTMITQEQFNKAIMEALEAQKDAEWTHQQRIDFYIRVESQIRKELDAEYKLEPNEGSHNVPRETYLRKCFKS